MDKIDQAVNILLRETVDEYTTKAKIVDIQDIENGNGARNIELVGLDGRDKGKTLDMVNGYPPYFREYHHRDWKVGDTVRVTMTNSGYYALTKFQPEKDEPVTLRDQEVKAEW